MPELKKVNNRPNKQRILQLKKEYLAKQPKTDPLDLMTKLIVAKLKKTTPLNLRNFDKQIKFTYLWLNSNKVEYLNNGIPYKIVDDYDVHNLGATFVTNLRGAGRLNAPIILVSSRFPNDSIRRNAAMHEYVEWQRLRWWNVHYEDGHNFAVTQENPKLREAAVRLINEYQIGMKNGTNPQPTHKQITEMYRQYPERIKQLKKELLRRKGIIGNIKSWFV